MSSQKMLLVRYLSQGHGLKSINWENRSDLFSHSVITKDVEPWTVVGGNPAKLIKRRVLNDE